MGFVGGDLMKVYAVGISFFGFSALVYFAWLFTTKRKYLTSMLWYAALSNTAMAILTLMLGFKFTLTTRSDGVQVFWLRWAFYAVIYGLCGVTHLYCEFSCQRQYFQRWATSLALGVAAVGPAVASVSGDTAQRIVALSIAALPFAAFSVAFWLLAQERRARTVVVMIAVNVLLGLYVLWFSLGSSGFAVVSGFTFVWESATYLIQDALLIALMPAVAMVLHCPRAIHGACAHGKKYDGVDETGQALVAPPLPNYDYGVAASAPPQRGGNSVSVVEFPAHVRM